MDNIIIDVLSVVFVLSTDGPLSVRVYVLGRKDLRHDAHPFQPCHFITALLKNVVDLYRLSGAARNATGQQCHGAVLVIRQ